MADTWTRIESELEVNSYSLTLEILRRLLCHFIMPRRPSELICFHIEGNKEVHFYEDSR